MIVENLSLTGVRPEATEIQDHFARILSSNAEVIIDSMRDRAGRVVLNADDLFMRWPEYRDNPERRRMLGPVLYGPARNFTNETFASLLAQPAPVGATVIFTAGGGASGKSSVLRAQMVRPNVDFVVDTTFSDQVRAFDQVDQALTAGRSVEIIYVFRPFEEAVVGMISRALDAENGRVVPIDDLARTHWGAQDTIFAAIEKYAEDPRVNIVLYESRTDEGLRELSVVDLIARILPDLDELKKSGQYVLDEAFTCYRQNYEREGLPFDGAFYEAARSRTT